MVAQMAVEGQSGCDPVPHCEDAVYHPSMSAVTWFAAALDALLDAEALARPLHWVGPRG